MNTVQLKWYDVTAEISEKTKGLLPGWFLLSSPCVLVTTVLWTTPTILSNETTRRGAWNGTEAPHQPTVGTDRQAGEPESSEDPSPSPEAFQQRPDTVEQRQTVPVLPRSKSWCAGAADIRKDCFLLLSLGVICSMTLVTRTLGNNEEAASLWAWFFSSFRSISQKGRRKNWYTPLPVLLVHPPSFLVPSYQCNLIPPGKPSPSLYHSPPQAHLLACSGLQLPAPTARWIFLYPVCDYMFVCGY